jgi:hypothetical protein
MEPQPSTSNGTRRIKAPRARASDRKAYGKLRVTNGRDFLPDVDGRSLIARRYRDIVSAIVTDQGGADQITEARLQLVRRFSAAALLAELLEAKLANGEEIDIAEHALLSSTMVRVAQRIGINRVPKPVVDFYNETLPELARQGQQQELQEPQEQVGDEL